MAAAKLGAGELLEAGMQRASNVAANVESKLGNLARTGSTKAEAAGVSTTVSSVAKPGSVVSRELVQSPGTGASVNTAAKSVAAETLPAKLVDRPMYGSAGASSLTRRQYVRANVAESHAINDNLGAGFNQFVQKERGLGASKGASANIDILPHGQMVKTPGSGQSHHLNQDAVFNSVIKTNDGLAIKLEGNAFTEIGSPHYNAHRSLERFYDQFRKGGEFYGEVPTNLQ